MSIRWGFRRRLRRAATALVALTLLPVAVFVVSAHPTAAPTASLSHPSIVGARDAELPSVEALQRGEASNLFAPVSWNGAVASGPFVAFGFSPSSGLISGYSAVNGSSAQVLVENIRIVGFTQSLPPQVVGPTFVANGLDVTFVAHQEPMALFEIETRSASRSVVFSFPDATSNLQVSRATAWPRASLSFAVGGSEGRIIVGRGNLTVSGTTVTAALESSDYLAFRAVPSFAEHAAARSAILDAFASGRLAAEYDLVAMTNGGWLENAALYQPDVTMISDGVEFSTALLTMNALAARGGLILLGFDPRTMPSDAGHELLVANNGVSIPEAKDSSGALYAALDASGQASFSRLSMNATVLVVYLPSLGAASLQVQSVAVPSPGVDVGMELGMVFALFIVSAAAAVMFRPRRG